MHFSFPPWSDGGGWQRNFGWQRTLAQRLGASRRVRPAAPTPHTPPPRSAAPARQHTGMHQAPREGRTTRTLRPLSPVKEMSSALPAAAPRSPGHPTDPPILLVLSLRSMPVLQRCRFSHFQAKWCRNGREKDDLVIRCSDGPNSLGFDPTGVNPTRKA
jgi:hypothetical protein